MLRLGFLMLIICLFCITSVAEALHICPECHRQYGNIANFCMIDGTRLRTSKSKTVTVFKPKSKIKREWVLKPGKRIGSVRINPKDGAKMVWVPAGKFMMVQTVMMTPSPSARFIWMATGYIRMK